MPSKLYKGAAMRDFIVDRYAMGYEDSAITKEYEFMFGVKLAELDVKKIASDNEESIKAREKEIQQLVLETNLFSQLQEATQSLLDRRDDANSNKEYAALVQQYLRALELNMKFFETFKKKQSDPKVQLIQQNNYFVFEELEKEGIINVKDKVKLQKLFGSAKDAKFERKVVDGKSS